MNHSNRICKCAIISKTNFEFVKEKTESITKSFMIIKEEFSDKFILDENIEKQPKGNRGIYGLFIAKNDNEECAYIGKSEILNLRITKHLYRIIDGEHAVSKLNNAFKDKECKIVCKFLEPVAYQFDNYYKDAQRLASRECHWIDEKQEPGQCLYQVPKGRRPSLD